MMPRELTSGFDFWSRGHLRMAVMHLPTKLGANIFVFHKTQDDRRPPYCICWGSHVTDGTTHEGSFMVRISCKNFVMIG